MTPIFFQCTVEDNKDPLLLGRVRAKINVINLPDVLKGIISPNYSPKDNWTERDPLIFLPLLPYFVYQVPKVGELIQVIFVNPDFKFQNQYYIQSNFFSVESIFNTNSFAATKETGTGMQFKGPNNLRNQSGSFPAKSKAKGLYPEPGDNALMGRGSADVIVKDTELILRAGKYNEVPQSNTDFSPNNNRSFLQLSIFDKTKVGDERQQEITSKPISLSVKNLIEWVIINPENEITNPDGTITNRFTGSIYLYSLRESLETNTNNISISSHIPEKNKYLIYEEDFQSLSSQEVINLINNFIKTCNDKNFSSTGRKLFSETQNKFPIFFRPASLSYEIISSGIPNSPNGQIAQQNLIKINNSIKLLPSDEPGTSNSQFNLIWKKDTTGLPSQVEIVTIVTPKFEPKPKTVSVLGGQEIYFLSQDSVIDGKEKINFADTIYGIPQSAFTQNILAKTSSMVRGEELLELLNLMVRFLVTHTHAFPALSPEEKTQDGTKTEDILTQMQNAFTKILNNNIRIN